MRARVVVAAEALVSCHGHERRGPQSLTIAAAECRYAGCGAVVAVTSGAYAPRAAASSSRRTQVVPNA